VAGWAVFKYRIESAAVFSHSSNLYLRNMAKLLI